MVGSINSGAGAAAHRRTILVIDDEPALAAMIARMLEDDYDVKVTSDGRKALALIRMEQPRFDVILCDLMMPNLTGSQVFDQARREQPGIETRFVFMTGGVFTPWAADFLAQSHCPCLEKPFAYEALRAIVRGVREDVRAAGPPARAPSE